MLAYSIMSYDFMKSQVVEINEAKQPCAWFSVAGVIYVCVYLTNSILGGI